MDITIKPYPNNPEKKWAEIVYYIGIKRNRKRLTVPKEIYQHLRESQQNQACERWAGSEIIKEINRNNQTKEEIEQQTTQTVDECFPNFLNHIAEIGTRDRYDTDYLCYLQVSIGKLTVSEASKDKTIDLIKAELQTRISRKTEKALSPSTVNGALNTVRAFFKWAKRQGLITRRPEIERVKDPKSTKLDPSKRYTADQQLLVLQIAKARGPMVYAAVLVRLQL